MELLILALVAIGIEGYVIYSLLKQNTTLALLVKSNTPQEFSSFQNTIEPVIYKPEDNEEQRMKSIDEMTPEEFADMKILS